jgi:hypothetical protein
MTPEEFSEEFVDDKRRAREHAEVLSDLLKEAGFEVFIRDIAGHRTVSLYVAGGGGDEVFVHPDASIFFSLGQRGLVRGVDKVLVKAGLGDYIHYERFPWHARAFGVGGRRSKEKGKIEEG